MNLFNNNEKLASIKGAGDSTDDDNRPFQTLEDERRKVLNNQLLLLKEKLLKNDSDLNSS
jgi:hypothetical protein